MSSYDYSIKIGLDKKEKLILLRDLAEINKETSKLEKEQILISLGIENVEDVNNVLEKITSERPELKAQIKYEINKSLYNKALEKKEELEDLTYGVSTDTLKYLLKNLENKSYDMETGDAVKELERILDIQKTLNAEGNDIDLFNIKDEIGYSRLQNILLNINDLQEENEKYTIGNGILKKGDDVIYTAINIREEFKKTTEEILTFKEEMKDALNTGAVDYDNIDFDDKKKIKNLERELENAEEEIRDLNTSLSDAWSGKFEAVNEVRDLTIALSDANKELTELKKNINEKPKESSFIAYHVGDLSKVGTDEFVNSDRLGILPDTARYTDSPFAGLFFSRMKDESASGEGMSENRKSKKYYELLLDKEKINFLSYEGTTGNEFDDQEAENRAIDALGNVNKYIAYTATNNKEFRSDLDKQYGIGKMSVEDLYDDLIETIPRFNKTYDEFNDFIEKNISKVKTLGDIVEKNNKLIYSNGNSNDLLPTNDLLDELGYDGFLPIKEGEKDGVGTGGALFHPEKFISSNEKSAQYISITKDAETFFENEENEMNLLSKAYEESEKKIEDAYVKVQNSIEKVKEIHKKLAESAVEGYADGQNSHSPAEDFVKLENYAIEGIEKGAEDGTPRLKHVGELMASVVKKGFEENIDGKTVEDSLNSIGNLGIIDLLDKISESLRNISSALVLEDSEGEIRNFINMLDELFVKLSQMNKKIGTAPINLTLNNGDGEDEAKKIKANQQINKQYDRMKNTYLEFIKDMESKYYSQEDVFAMFLDRDASFTTLDKVADMYSLSSIDKIEEPLEKIKRLATFFNELKKISQETDLVDGDYYMKTFNDAVSKIPMSQTNTRRIDSNLRKTYGLNRSKKNTEEEENALNEIIEQAETALNDDIQKVDFSKVIDSLNEIKTIIQEISQKDIFENFKMPDDVIEKYEELIRLLTSYNEESKKNSDSIDDKKIISEDEFSKFANLESVLDRIVKLIEQKNELLKQESDLVEQNVPGEEGKFDSLRLTLNDIVELIEKIEKFNEILDALTKERDFSSIKSFNDLKEILKDLSEIIDGFITDDKINRISADLDSLINKDFSSLDSLSKFIETLDKLSTSINDLIDGDKFGKLNNALDVLKDNKGLSSLSENIKEIKSSVNEIDKTILKDLNKLLENADLMHSLKNNLEEKNNKTNKSKKNNKNDNKNNNKDAKKGHEEYEYNERVIKNAKSLSNRLNEFKKIKSKNVDTITDNESDFVKSFLSDKDDLDASNIKNAKNSQKANELVSKFQDDFTKNMTVIYNDYMHKLNNTTKKIKDKLENEKLSDEDVKNLNSSLTDINDYLRKIEEISVNFDYENIEDEDFRKLDEFVKTSTGLVDRGTKSTRGTKNNSNESNVTELYNRIAKLLNENKKANKKYGEQLRKLYNVLERYVKDGNLKLTNDELSRYRSLVNQIESEINDENLTGKSFMEKIGDKARDSNAKLISRFFSFYDIIRYAREGFEIIREFDTALTEMRKVSDESVESLKRYQTQTFATANAIGSNALALQNATADWMRLGESMNEAAESAKQATILMNVSEFDNINDATTSLVAMSQAYKDLEKGEIIDVLNNIGNNYSISTSELATALQQSAAALSTQGNDINKAVALITAGNAITQDADKTGTGIRTISLRIAGTQEAKEELEELGEDTEDYVVQTQAKKRKVIKDFTSVASNNGQGVDILDDNGNLKDTYEILKEISYIYKEIQEEDKKYGTNRAKGLIEELAGKNRSNIAASILQNPEMLTSVYEDAQNSAGSAMEENEKHLDSINGKLEQLKNNLYELLNDVVNSEVLKAGLDIAGGFVSFLDTIIKKFTILAPLAAGLLAYTKFSKKGGLIANIIGTADIATELQRLNGSKNNKVKAPTIANNISDFLQKNSKKLNMATAFLGISEGSEVDEIKAALEGLTLAESQELMIKKSINEATREKVLTDMAAANATELLAKEEIEGAAAAAAKGEREGALLLRDLELTESEYVLGQIEKETVRIKIEAAATAGLLDEAKKEELITNLGLAESNNELSASYKKAEKSGKKFVSTLTGFLAKNPYLTAFLAVVAAIVAALGYLSHTHDEAYEDLEEYSKKIDDTKKEIDELDNKLKENKNRIDELSKMSKSNPLTFVEQEELNNLSLENDYLERQLELKNEILKKNKENQVSSAKAALTSPSIMPNSFKEFLFAWSRGNTNNSANLFAKAANSSTKHFAEDGAFLGGSDITTLESRAYAIEEYQQAYEYYVKKDMPRIAEQYKSLIEETRRYSDEYYQNVESAVKVLEENGKTNSEEYREAIKALNDYSYAGQDENTRNRHALDNFFSSNESTKKIKDEISRNVGEKKTDVEIGDNLSKSLSEIGISIDDINTDMPTLIDYFKDLNVEMQRTNTEAGKLSTIFAGATFDDVKDAFESDDQDKKWQEMAGYVSEVKTLAEGGFFGKDNMQKLIDFFTVGGVDTKDLGVEQVADAYKTQYDKLKEQGVFEWFDAEDETASVLKFWNNFQSIAPDLVNVDGTKVTTFFSTTQEAAEKLGVSIESVELMLQSMESYGFDFSGVEFTAKSLNNYKKSIEEIKDIYKELDPSTNKSRLGDMLNQWSRDLNEFETGQKAFNEGYTIKINFEIKQAELDKTIQEATRKIKLGDDTPEVWANLISTEEEKYNNILEQMDIDNTSFESTEIGKPYGQKIAVARERLNNVITNKNNGVYKNNESAYETDYQKAMNELHSVEQEATYVAQGVYEQLLRARSKNDIEGKDEVLKFLNELKSTETPLRFFVEIDDKKETLEKIKETLQDQATGSTISFNYSIVDKDGNTIDSTINAVKEKDNTITFTADLNGDGLEETIYAIEGEDNEITFTSNADMENAYVAVDGFKTFVSEQQESFTVFADISNAWSSFTALIGAIGNSSATIPINGDLSLLQSKWNAFANAVNGHFNINLPTFTVSSSGSSNKDQSSNNGKNLNDVFIPSPPKKNGGSTIGGGDTHSTSSKSGSGDSGGGGGSDGGDSDKFEEEIDWIETKISRIEREVDNLNKLASRTWTNWNTRSFALLGNLMKVTEEIDAQTGAFWRYLSAAESVGLNDFYKQKVQNGTIDLETITDEALNDQISKYRDYYEKALEAADAIEDLKDTQVELVKQSFDDLTKQYEDLIGVIDRATQKLENFIDLQETKGYLISNIYYTKEYEKEQEHLNKLQEERNALWQKFADSVNQGWIEFGSEMWYEMNAQIEEVDLSIQDVTKHLVELKNAIRDNNWSIFDKKEDYKSALIEESNFIIDTLSKRKLYEENGVFNNKGASVVGMRAVNYDAYMQQAQDYKNAILELDREIANDPYNTVLVERRHELLKAQQDNISAALDEKDAIRDLVSDGYDILVDYLNKLIDKYNDLLDSQKDLYDYEKSIREQTTAIADYRKQLVSLSGDDSEENQARLQELQENLRKSEEELEETEYEQWLHDQQKMLDDMMDDFELWVSDRLDNIDGILQEQIDATNDNAAMISDTIKEELADLDYLTSPEMSDLLNYATCSIHGFVSSFHGDFLNKSADILRVLQSIDSWFNKANEQSNAQAVQDTNSGCSSSNSGCTSQNQGCSNPAPANNGCTSNNNGCTQGNGVPEVGDVVTLKSGCKYYYDSYGTAPSGHRYAGVPNGVVIDAVNSNPYGIHIHSADGQYKDLGWVRWDELEGYATGRRNGKEEMAWTQEQGRELIFRKSDGAMLTPLGSGDKVFTNEQTEKLWSLSKGLTSIDGVKSAITTPNISSSVSYGDSSVTFSGDINMVGVNDPQSFADNLRRAINNDIKVQKTLQANTIGIAIGKNKFIGNTIL